MLKKLTLGTALVAAAGTVAFYLVRNRLYKDLYARFPEIPHWKIRKAYNQVVKDAVSGKYDLDGASDSTIEMLFRFKVLELDYELN